MPAECRLLDELRHRRGALPQREQRASAHGSKEGMFEQHVRQLTPATVRQYAAAMDFVLPGLPLEPEHARRWAVHLLRNVADRLAHVPSAQVDEVLMHPAGPLTALERQAALVLR